MDDLNSGNAMLRMIEMAMAKPAGTVTHVDIIHADLCGSRDAGNELECTCTPEVRERFTQ
jgi:hypothetical protein